MFDTICHKGLIHQLVARQPNLSTNALALRQSVEKSRAAGRRQAGWWSSIMPMRLPSGSFNQAALPAGISATPSTVFGVS